MNMGVASPGGTNVIPCALAALVARKSGPCVVLEVR
jgi:hypothetical protein